MSDFKEFVSNPGSRYRPVYQPAIGDDGIVALRQIDVVDYYQKIQADKTSCDINYLLQRYAAGDTSALGFDRGLYADITSAPKSLAEAYEMNARCEAAFNQLPLAVREKFDHNYYKFLASAGSADWLKAVFPDEVKEQEVTPVEQKS